MGEQRRSRGGGLLGPLILIAVGLVFLLNNLGLLGWSIWQVLFHLWPLLLIAVGLDLLVRSRWGSSATATIGSLVIVALVLAVGALVISLSGPGTTFEEMLYGYGPGQTDRARMTDQGAGPRTENIDQPLDGARRAVVDVGVGVGPMDLRAMSEPDGLVEGTLALWEGGEISRDFRVSGDTAYFTLRGGNTPAFHVGGDGSQRWDLRLNPDVPTELKIHAGVGEAEIDLSKLLLTGLEVDAGVSRTTVTLPRHGRLQARVNGGVSSLTVLIPQGMAARVQVERGLSSVDVTGNFQRQGDTYVSPGYEAAQDRVDLAIKGGIGRVTVQEVDAQ